LHYYSRGGTVTAEELALKDLKNCCNCNVYYLLRKQLKACGLMVVWHGI